ncbi:AAA domain-containing protein [Flindersiella endophytica]
MNQPTQPAQPTTKEPTAANDLRADRALRLLTFLRELQALRTRPVRTLDRFPRVVWLSDIPADSRQVDAIWTRDDQTTQAHWLAIERIDREPPPQLPDTLARHVVHADLYASDHSQPRLRDDAGEEAAADYLDWLPTWQQWAERDRRNAAVRAAYQELYALHQDHRGSPETFEIVLGLGLLHARSGGVQARRHLITVRAAIGLDADTGRLTVGVDPEDPEPRLEEDMLDAEDHIPADLAAELRADLQQLDQLGDLFAGTAPEREPAEHKHTAFAAARRWAHVHRHDTLVSDSFTPPETARGATQASVTLAPALILRPRDPGAFYKAIDTIRNAIESGTRVPDSLAQVLLETTALDDTAEAAANDNDDEQVYFPLPSNDEQQAVLRGLREHRVVAVQGPPGTGKTHTIANLVTDLLAHGQRVLIVSHKAQALKRVRELLPDDVRDLCVDVTGSSARTQSELEHSVNNLIDRVERSDERALDDDFARLRTRFDAAAADRDQALEGLRELRAWEGQQVPAYEGRPAGTPQQLAERLRADEPTYSWLAEPDDQADRVTSEEALRLLELLRLPPETRSLATYAIPDRTDLVSPSELADLDNDRLRLRERLDSMLDSGPADAALPDLRGIDPAELEPLREIVLTLRQELTELSLLELSPGALQQVWTGQTRALEQLSDDTRTNLTEIQSALVRLGPARITGLEALDPRQAETQLRLLADNLAKGKPLQRLGRPTKLAREADAVLANVRVDGLACDTEQRALTAATACSAAARLRDLESEWGQGETAGSLRMRTAKLEEQLAALERALKLRPAYETARAVGVRTGLAAGRWHDLTWIESLHAALFREDLQAQLAEFTHRREPVLKQLRRAGRGEHPHPAIEAATRAVEEWDVDGYAAAWREFEAAWTAAAQVQEAERLLDRLARSSPTVATQLAVDPGSPLWDSRFADIEAAYAWSAQDRWLREQLDPVRRQLLADQLRSAEDRKRRLTEAMAVNRSWRFCRSRMTAEEARNLRVYAATLKKAGKGTGKYAPKYHADARAALSRAHSAIPAWIMPMRSVVASVPFERPNLFDVVIVDEASQSGHEALLLFWLGKKVLVVGDDEQISPESVGIDFERIFRLRAELLPDFPSRELFDPYGSLLDHAKTMAPSPVMLKEHFRCMPEIIDFSNGLCYRDDLLPVRQFGLDRLPPIRTTFLDGARTQGTGQRTTNRAEAEEIVETIGKCCADPAYSGKSMGVITLLGTEQARLISSLLVERLGPAEMERRALRVDKPEGFQGDERNVVFLSMVAATQGDSGPRRLGTLSKKADKQRLNVAASRAQDQVWVFYSVRAEQLPKQDLRADYLTALRRPREQRSGAALGEVLADLRHESFDTLFEQRVYLALDERGYHVRPQYVSGRYSIDLVVYGGTSRLAIECDGDPAELPMPVPDDPLHQLELERMGWRFERVAASRFARDPVAALEPVWSALDRLGIQPGLQATDSAIHLEQPVAGALMTTAGPTPAAVIEVGAASQRRLAAEAAAIRKLPAGTGTPAEHERLRDRLVQLDAWLERCQPVEADRLPGRAWPGAVFTYLDLSTGETARVVLSTVDTDPGIERLAPDHPLAEQLAEAGEGQELTYDLPDGNHTTVRVQSISD